MKGHFSFTSPHSFLFSPPPFNPTPIITTPIPKTHTHTHTSCLQLLTTPFVEIGIWGFQLRRRVDTNHTHQETEQSRVLFPSLSASPSFLSFSLSLTLSPLSVCLQDPVSLLPASQPDSYVGETNWLSTEKDVKSGLPKSSLHDSHLGVCYGFFCCFFLLWVMIDKIFWYVSRAFCFWGLIWTFKGVSRHTEQTVRSSISVFESYSASGKLHLLFKSQVQGQSLSDSPHVRI